MPRVPSPFLALAVLLALAPAMTRAADAPAKGLDLYFIDVMGGAATLLVTPEGESFLIDSGWPGEADRDPKRIVHVLKDVAKLDRLDHLVTTHWHMDHFGGVAGLSKLVPIGHFWDRGLPDPSAPDHDKAKFPDGPMPDDPLGIAYLKASAGKRTTLRAGDTLPLKGQIRATVIAASNAIESEHAPIRDPANPLCAQAPPDQAPDPSDNALSLALHVRTGRFRFLDCGDLTWNVEKRLVCPHDLVGPIDLFQVTHHGMDISNHPSLLQTIRPTVAIMDNGPRKGGSPATVARLQSLASLKALYQLHKNAATPPDQNTAPSRIANADPAGGQFLRVSVTPDGSHFTVQIGTDGPSETFECHPN